ncbi:MAG: NADP-dependent isocitrate dehydrogenase [Alphaproteobacteria bacterium]
MPAKITIKDEVLLVPDDPIIGLLPGDGIGPEVVGAAVGVINAAVSHVYDNKRKIHWLELPAGEQGLRETGELLPQTTLDAVRAYKVALKGPMTTPVGSGFRSINVALRRELDLYACIRPVRHYQGVPSPLCRPDKLNVVIFRENTEDVYTGVEYAANSEEAHSLLRCLHELGAIVRDDSAVGIKPISQFGSKRLIKVAINYALKHVKRRVTFVHKGNIMKYTEGAFRNWGYELAREMLGDRMVTADQVGADREPPPGKILVQDKIADAMFQDLILRPRWHDVIATTNLNGDYLSDAAAAQVGGLGMAPGANIGDEVAVFEATHGSAPHYAGQDKVNPSSVILSGVMMLDHLGWPEAARVVENALEATIGKGTVTYDLARLLSGSTKVSCSGFGRAVEETIRRT